MQACCRSIPWGLRAWKHQHGHQDEICIMHGCLACWENIKQVSLPLDRNWRRFKLNLFWRTDRETSLAELISLSVCVSVWFLSGCQIASTVWQRVCLNWILIASRQLITATSICEQDILEYGWPKAQNQQPVVASPYCGKNTHKYIAAYTYYYLAGKPMGGSNKCYFSLHPKIVFFYRNISTPSIRTSMYFEDWRLH